jgi:hypothetical protein
MSQAVKRKNAFSRLRRLWSWLRFPTYALLFFAWWQYSSSFFDLIWYLSLLGADFMYFFPKRLNAAEAAEVESLERAAEDLGLEVAWARAGAGFVLTVSGLMPELSVVKESAGSGFAKRVLGADIEVGDAAFDRDTYLEGPVMETLSRLNQQQRDRLESTLSAYTSRNEGGVRVGIADGVLTVEGSTKLLPLLRWAGDMEVLSIAKGFARVGEGTKEERLLGIVRGDPNSLVREKVLFEMMRHQDELEVDLDALLIELIHGEESPSNAEVTEEQAVAALQGSSTVALAAASWLRDHGESTASIEALKPHLEAGGRAPIHHRRRSPRRHPHPPGGVCRRPGPQPEPGRRRLESS